MRLDRRALRRLRRHPVGFWLTTAGLAGLTAAVLLHAGARADAEYDRWGRLAHVVVLARDVEPGDLLDAADLKVERFPARLAPPGALHAIDDALDRAATAPLHEGEVLLANRLAPDGLVGVAALLPEGHRAVAIPVDGAGLEVRVGDAVDVLATFEAEPTVVVAQELPVVAVGEEVVTVAVPADDVAEVAYAVARAAVTLALSGPPRWR